MSLYGRIFAATYDRVFAGSEEAGLAQMRAGVVSRARGRTLELGAGTGLNLRHYTAGAVQLTLTEPEEPMLGRLRQRVAAEGVTADLVKTGAERLPFTSDSFDTIVATLVLCTVSDQAAVLAEMRRVLRPDGTLFFLEHVRSERRSVARLQDLIQPVWIHVGHGCHCNLDTLKGIRAAGFAVGEIEHTELPLAPRFVRPLIVGAAAPLSASDEGPATADGRPA